MKYRIKISQAITIILLLAAKPCSWTLFYAGMILALCGECIRIWSAGNLYKDKTLAVYGPYKMARNPLYIGSFLMAMGFALVCFNAAYPWRSAALILAVLAGFKWVYNLQVAAEETHLYNLFGEAYASYKNSVPRYIPALGAFPEAAASNKFTLAQMLYNGEQQTIFGLVSIGALLGIEIACNTTLSDLLRMLLH
jgi:protein-S-isoprenylcysteine O-methyltransferase Ste14